MVGSLTSKLTIGIILDTSLDLEDGVQQYVMAIGEWLRAQGHDVHYLVGQTERRQLPNIHSLSRNVVVKFNGNRVDLPLIGNMKRIKQVFSELQFDVLHVQTPHHPLLAQRIIKQADPRTAVVASFHILPYSPLIGFTNRLLGYWLRPSLKRVDQMLAVSPAAARFEKQTFGLDAEVSPNVFSYPTFKNAKPFERYDDDTITLLFLGRLVPRKGCQLLLDAVDMLHKEAGVPKFRVVVCGRGPLAQNLRNFAKARGIDSLVEFCGFVSNDDKPRYYASADIAVFPSNSGESFGIVLLEAMASGKAAVLAGDNPGYRSVMEARPETLFDPKNAAALAMRLRELMADQKARQELAEWGSHYSQNFDVDVVGAQLVALYRRLLAAKNVR
jgi:phosphatidylinositol alpha-mannosyltransferase